jgi:uncharacterized membrane protein
MTDRRSIGAVLTRLRNLFLQGIALLAPLALTLALVVWLGHSVEVVVGSALKQFLPAGWYVPGLGLAAGIGLTLVAGLLANLFLVRWLLNALERLLDRIPLVKSLFKGLKDVSRFFEQGGDEQIGRPVSVSLPLSNGDIRLVGFVMQERARLPSPAGPDATSGTNPGPTGDANDQETEGRIAVYLPMSYQVGGYTLYLDPTQVHSLDVSPDEALRAVLTGGALTGGASSRGSVGAPGGAANRHGREAESKRIDDSDDGGEPSRDSPA